MSAGQHGSTVGGKQMGAPITDKHERYITNLCRSVNIACDEWQMRNNGYKHKGLRDTINTSVLKAQGERKSSDQP
jgi:inhibitor of KinA sporulation pathway (predicted exonuclease)